MDNHIFRSAISGFNRQDVTEYIEKVRKEAQETQAALESEQAAARQELEALGQTAGESRDRCQELEGLLEDSKKELASLREEFAALSAQKDELEARCGEQEGTIAGLTAEKSALKAQVEELTGEREDLRREKERVAQLELEARGRCEALEAQTAEAVRAAEIQAQAQAAATVEEARSRADAILAQAREEAERTAAQAREQAQALLSDSRKALEETSAAYRELTESFAGIAAHVSGELRRMDVAASQLTLNFDRTGQRLKELTDAPAKE